MRKIITYTIFFIACIAVVVIFLTAKTYEQLVVAIALYPAIFFIALKIFPREKWKSPMIAVQVSGSQQTPKYDAEVLTKNEEIPSVGVADIDKRAFLKLIGGAGIALFLFSIFNKRAEGLFLGKGASSISGPLILQDTNGNNIDPAQNQPTDGYKISEVDDNVVTFYGFTNRDGAWFVMKEDTETGSFRYSKGDKNFPASWSNRENLNYDYYSNIF